MTIGDLGAATGTMPRVVRLAVLRWIRCRLATGAADGDGAWTLPGYGVRGLLWQLTTACAAIGARPLRSSEWSAARWLL